MADERFVLGIFEDEKVVAQAVKALQDTSWSLRRVFSPFPSERINEALELRTSPVGLFTLGGAIFGFVSGLVLSA
jgi:hypothetical protein